ncbi:MAG: carbohydrate kinase family protein [Mollicutes bacterium]|jgi:sugar/nucleoside kinase (ribokinase family)|nr:carbohydrate kinase family protein [Mollicutes bacterium]
MKILCIGHASYDISMPISEYPTENKKYRVNGKIEGGGGPACTAAYLLGKWGMETYFAGVVGNDLYGTRIKTEYETVGVNTKYLETNYEDATDTSFIIINQQTGSRTILSNVSEKMQLTNKSIDLQVDVILIDGHEYEASKQALMLNKSAISIIDAGRPTEQVIELAGKVKYLVCSKEFAETVSGVQIDYTNTETIVKLYQTLKEKFNNEIIVTLEAHGALYSINGEIKIMPGIKVKAVDTTGAGDIFHGAFTYAIANNRSLESAIKLANITAGLSATKVGSRNSIFKYEDVEIYAKNINESIY